MVRWTISSGEMRLAQPGKSIQWIDLSIERRELRRAAGPDTKKPGIATGLFCLCLFFA